MIACHDLRTRVRQLYQILFRIKREVPDESHEDPGEWFILCPLIQVPLCALVAPRGETGSSVNAGNTLHDSGVAPAAVILRSP